MANCAMRSPASGCWLSHSDSESCTKLSTSDAASRDGEPLLHLPGELRLLDLDRQHEAALVEDVFGRELDAARHQVAEFAELAHRARDAGAQAVHVRAAFDGRE